MTSAAQLLSEQDHKDTWSLTIGKDMSDEDIEFVREAGAKLRELSQRYRAALREMVVRFEILDQDLNLRKDRTPIHHVESRVKTPESIIEKIGRYGKERTLENIEKYIMDIAGIRVICSYISDVYNLFDLLQRAYIESRYNPDFEITKADIDALLPKIELLRDVVEQVCNERLAYYDSRIEK
mgnify:FL=1